MAGTDERGGVIVGFVGYLSPCRFAARSRFNQVRGGWKGALNLLYNISLLSKTGADLATRVANGGFACLELEF